MGVLPRRKGLAGLVIAALGAAVLWAGPPARAASLGTVTVSYTGGVGYSVSPTTLTGSIGDTFTLANTIGGGAPRGVSLVNATGAVSLGGVSCALDASCRVDDAGGGGTSTGVFTIATGGTISVRRTTDGTSYSTIGTITINASGSGSGSNPLKVKFTATADANGGACTGTTSWERYPGSAAFAGVFTLPTAAQCTRTGYTLLGWATVANAASAAYAPGAEYSMGDFDVTLYAVWRPAGIEVIYDANVGLETQCIGASGKNLISAAERRSQATVVAVRGWSANGAPCYPPGASQLDFAGWALTGNGASIVVPGGLLPDSLKSGDSVTLFAKWVPPQRVTLPQTGQLKPARTITITGVRTEVSGKPGIVVTGKTSGFANGEVLEPWYKSSEKAKYRATSPDATVMNGEFTWSRQTGIEDSYVFFMSIESIQTITKKVKSNDLLIPAQ